VIRIAIALTALLTFWQATAAPPTGAPPRLNERFEQAEVSRWKAVFERPGREVWDHRREIVDALELQPGMDVADVGAGTGFFTFLFVEAVGPAGKVYALDISRPFVRAIAERARREGRPNVIAVRNTDHSALLPARSVDLVFLADTYHHFEYPRDMLASLHAALRPGGEMVVVDFRKDPHIATPWVMRHVRAGKTQVIREIEAAGFEFTGERNFLRTHYFLRFRKR